MYIETRGSHFHAQNISIQINCTENDCGKIVSQMCQFRMKNVCLYKFDF